jgi:hypothetical protein
MTGFDPARMAQGPKQKRAASKAATETRLDFI